MPATFINAGLILLGSLIGLLFKNFIPPRFSSIVTAGGGTVEKVDDWGKRKLAYPIQDLNDGHYILMHFSANPELPYELERNMKINENIMRYLVIRKDA